MNRSRRQVKKLLKKNGGYSAYDSAYFIPCATRFLQVTDEEISEHRIYFTPERGWQ